MATTKSSKKRSSGSSGGSSSGSSGSKGGGSGMLSAVTGTAAADTLIDLVNRLGLVDVMLGRVKSRIEETDLDELMEEVTDYMRRNPEVLVVSLGAVTVAAGLLVWLNNRREWDGTERRGATVTSSPGRVRRTATSRVAEESDDDEE